MDHYIAHHLYSQLYENANVTTQGTVLETDSALNEKIDEIVILCKERFKYNNSVKPLEVVYYIHECLNFEKYSALYDTGILQYIIVKCLEIFSNID
tara:strand:- start:691 stop:978 length:288 start_codon:yes stop_codon:yes gene_type:complete